MKENIFKIGDLPENFNLVGCKLKGKTIISGWPKGFWLEAKKNSSQVTPIFFKNFDEIKNWEVEVPIFRINQIVKKKIK